MEIRTFRRASQVLFLFLVPFLFWKGALLYFLLGSLLSSLAVGRAFCSWVCPLGTVYEFWGMATRKRRPRYHCRTGCPFSLPIGLMNRISFFKIRRDEDRCKHCNTCRLKCPVGVFDIAGDANPSVLYACIRCLTCVSSCPNGALSFVLDYKSKGE